MTCIEIIWIVVLVFAIVCNIVRIRQYAGCKRKMNEVLEYFRLRTELLGLELSDVIKEYMKSDFGSSDEEIKKFVKDFFNKKLKNNFRK